MNDQPLDYSILPPDPGGARPTWDPSAAAAGLIATAVLALAIYSGSANLLHFDAALVGYTLATLFLAFGATYRLVTWSRSPAARRYLSKSRKALLPRPLGDGTLTASAREVTSTVLLQRFIAKRSRPRWLAHQGLFWGVILATLITFPLTFGWIHFRAVPGTGSGYYVYMMGVRAAHLDALSLLGWLTFHALDLASLLILSGGAYFLWHRWSTRGNSLTQLGRDLMPLLALMAISVTGLALTVSSVFMEGAWYQPLAFVHMCTVVLTLVWIPFGKFFHTLQRPAMAGVGLHKELGVQKGGVAQCVRCGEPVEGTIFLDDLKQTMGELGLGFGDWVETCPSCKRLERGAAYRNHVKEGYR
ncbi:MAG: MFS transporter [Actinobacteria bacterium]|nr:MFS transporter [Actinomycetota bacterium]